MGAGDGAIRHLGGGAAAASRRCPVAVCDTVSQESAARLDAVLEPLGFDATFRPKGGNTRATILVDLGAFEIGSPVLPDRPMIEHLIDRLTAIGWSEVSIASTADSSSTWAENRDFFVLADLFGYRYETALGTPYDVVDLSENLVDAAFPEGSVLAGSPLSAGWAQAGLRVVVAKAGTDPTPEDALKWVYA